MTGLILMSRTVRSRNVATPEGVPRHPNVKLEDYGGVAQPVRATVS